MENRRIQQTNIPLPPKRCGADSLCEDKAIDLFYANKKLLTDHAQSLSIETIPNVNSVKILKKERGEAFVGAFLIGLLKEFLTFVPNTLKPDDVALYAAKMLSDHPDWKTDDFILCLKRGIDGRYGPIKFNFTYVNWVEWSGKYQKEKDDFIYNNHLINKSKSDESILKFIPPKILEKFTQKTETISKSQAKQKTDIHIPQEIINQGIKAIDQWIEKHKLNGR